MIKITNKSDSALIQIFGDIGESFFSDGWTFEKFNNQLKGLDVPNLTIELKSNGGDLMEAFAIYDAIKKMPARVTVDIVGASASAATIIASGADKIRISENSRYLVHNAMSFVDGNKEAMKSVYDQLVSFDNQILDVYVKRTGKPRNVLAELMQEEKWITAQEALTYGFVDEIIKSKIENKMEIKNVLSPEEETALIEERDSLLAQVEELTAKVAELEGATEAAIEEDVKEKVENAIKEGKLKAELRDSMIAFGKFDNVSMTAAINAIYVAPKLAGVPNPGAPIVDEMTPEIFRANFKANKYVGNSAKYAADFEKAYGKKVIV